MLNTLGKIFQNSGDKNCAQNRETRENEQIFEHLRERNLKKKKKIEKEWRKIEKRIF